MANRPSRQNRLGFAVRSKEYITERLALEAILAVQKTGRTSGDVPELGLSVQRQFRPGLREPVYYIRQMKGT